MNASATSQIHQQINLQSPSPPETGGGEPPLTPAHEEVIKDLQAKKEASEKEKGGLEAQVAIYETLTLAWRFAYLNLFLVPNSKSALLWIHSIPSQSRDVFHTHLGTTIPEQKERDTILNVLTTNALVVETLSQLSVTQEGLAFLRYIGLVPAKQ